MTDRSCDAVSSTYTIHDGGVSCEWFMTAVLPMDEYLYKKVCSEIMKTEYAPWVDGVGESYTAQPVLKACCLCGKPFLPGSNRAKYCAECANRVERVHATQRKRKERHQCHDLGLRKAL